MGKRTVALAVVAGVAVGAVGVAVAGRSGEDGDGDAASDPVNRAAALVERLGCDRGRFYLDPDGGWRGADVRDCEEGPIVARIYGALESEEREAAVRSLSTEDGPGGDMAEWCAENEVTGADFLLVVGDAWVAVVMGGDDAATAAERLDGELRADPVPTRPVDSLRPLLCLPGPQ